MSREQHYRAIWREGYRRPDGRGVARLEGVAIGTDLADACNAHAAANPMWARAFDPHRMTHDGCRLFDSHLAASARYG